MSTSTTGPEQFFDYKTYSGDAWNGEAVVGKVSIRFRAECAQCSGATEPVRCRVKNLGHFTNSLATCASRRQGSATSVVQSATSVVQSAGCAGFRRVSRAPATNSTRTAKKSGARAPLPRLTTHSLHCSKPTLPHWPPPTLSRASRAPTDNSSLSQTRLAQQKNPVLAHRSHA